MKIKLIIAPSIEPELFLPLGVGVLHAQLSKNNIDIEIIDMNILLRLDCFSRGDLPRHLREIAVDRERCFKYLSGCRDDLLDQVSCEIVKPFSFNDTDVFLVSFSQLLWERRDYLAILLVLKYIREKYSDCAIILGGEPFENHPVYDHFKVINELGLGDFLIRGYGEDSLLDLLKNLESGSPPLESIPGLVFLRQGQIIKSEKVFNPNLVEPDYSGFDLDAYRWPVQESFIKKYELPKLDIDSVLVLPVKFTSGCIKKCAFCTNSGGKYKLRYLQPDEIAQGLVRAKNKYNTPFFHFNDDLTNPHKRYIDKISDFLIEINAGIRYSACVQFATMDRESLEKMRRSGVTRLVFGCETGSARIHNLIGKEVNIKQAEQVLKDCFELGVWTGVDIISGLPHENEDDVEETINFLKRNEKYIGEIYCVGFYLAEDSLMGMFPEKFGIRNIRLSSEDLFSHNRGEKRVVARYNYTFDEINGLKWEEKQYQIENSRDKLKTIFKEKIAFSDYEIQERLHILFYLDMALINRPSEEKFLVYRKILVEETKRYTGPRVQEKSWLSVDLLKKRV